MGSFSIWHWLVVLAVILLLFGGGNKISSVMGDFAKGVKAFKKNMADNDETDVKGPSTQPGSISDHSAQASVQRDTAHSSNG